QPHYRRHLVAVAVELFESFEAARFQIGYHAVDHGVEVFGRDAKAPDRMVKSRPDGMPAETALESAGELGAPAVEGRARSAGFVAQIVAMAHEGVDGAHGLALLPGKQHEGVVEILGAAAR